MEILTQLWAGIVQLIGTPVGFGALVFALVVLFVLAIKWTPTEKDDKWLATTGAKIFSYAAVAEKAIPDGTQIKALQFVDQVLKAMQQAKELDAMNKKDMTALRATLKNFAEASKKVDTTNKKELAELSDFVERFTKF